MVTVQQNGSFVPVSNEMYITNPEAVAAKSTAYPARSKKGLTADWRYSDELASLGVGFASYELDVSRFFTAGGIPYTYNGKTYSFNASVVREYDVVCTRLAGAGCNVVMVIKIHISRRHLIWWFHRGVWLERTVMHLTSMNRFRRRN